MQEDAKGSFYKAFRKPCNPLALPQLPSIMKQGAVPAICKLVLHVKELDKSSWIFTWFAYLFSDKSFLSQKWGDNSNTKSLAQLFMLLTPKISERRFCNSLCCLFVMLLLLLQTLKNTWHLWTYRSALVSLLGSAWENAHSSYSSIQESECSSI